MRVIVPTKANIKHTSFSWIYKMIAAAFFLSLGFAFISAGIIPTIPLWAQITILASFILINILFDTIGTAVAAASQTPFHSMNARQVKGASQALKLIRNGEKVSNFCNDVIGDICGVISGGTIAIMIDTLTKKYYLPTLITGIILTSLISTLIISGKSLGKTFALKNSNQIVYDVSLLLTFFKR